MILHTINKTAARDMSRELVADDDEIVLLEDGVYVALQKDFSGYAIEADVEARGLKDKVSTGTHLITYADFVELTVRADKVCAWF